MCWKRKKYGKSKSIFIKKTIRKRLNKFIKAKKFI